MFDLKVKCDRRHNILMTNDRKIPGSDTDRTKILTLTGDIGGPLSSLQGQGP